MYRPHQFLLVIAATVVFSQNLFASPIVNFSLGPTLRWIKLSSDPVTTDNRLETFGPSVGINVRLKKTFSPEVGAQFSTMFLSSTAYTGGTELTIRGYRSYLSVPITISFIPVNSTMKFYPISNLGISPIILLTEKAQKFDFDNKSVSSEYYDMPNGYKKVDLELVGSYGVGRKINSGIITLMLSHEFGLINLSEYGEAHNRAVQLTLGYSICRNQ